MEMLLTDYKQLKKKLTPNLGCEESMDEVMWNEGVAEAMDNLLENVPKDIAQMIRLGHL